MKYAGINEASQAVLFALPFACLFATCALLGAAYVYCSEHFASSSIDMVLGLGDARRILFVGTVFVFLVAYSALLIAKRSAMIRVVILLFGTLPLAPLIGVLYVVKTNGVAYHFCGI
jgi:hypothetical protein